MYKATPFVGGGGGGASQCIPVVKMAGVMIGKKNFKSIWILCTVV